MADRRNHVSSENFTGAARRVAATLLGIACAVAASAAAAQGAGPYYEDDSVVVDLSVLDDGGRGKRSGVLPPAGVVPGSSRSLMMPGMETPRSRFHGLSGPGASPQVSAKAAQPKRVATPKPKAAPKAEQMAEAKPAPAPKAAPMAPVTAAQPAPPPPAAGTTPPPPPPISTPAPLPPAPVAQPQAAPTDAAPAIPPAAPIIAAAPAPAAPPAPVVAPMAPPAPAQAPAQPLSIAPPAASVASAPVPPPAAAQPAAKPPEAPSQAALPPATAPVGDRAMQVLFAAGDSRIPNDAQGGLKDLAERMKAKESLRMQLVAYAAGGDLSSSAARRLSLSRALAIRTLLIDNGVRSTRIDVRALGDKAPDEPANRVDISLSER